MAPKKPGAKQNAKAKKPGANLSGRLVGKFDKRKGSAWDYRNPKIIQSRRTSIAQTTTRSERRMTACLYQDAQIPALQHPPFFSKCGYRFKKTVLKIEPTYSHLSSPHPSAKPTSNVKPAHNNKPTPLPLPIVPSPPERRA